MQLEDDQCYDALKARDTRFDGKFFVAVSSTGIYCRPVCRVRMPARKHCRFYASAADAEAAGYRPCLRCRPELAPDVKAANALHSIADRAVAHIETGALSHMRVDELAATFGVSSRQLRRSVEQEYGFSPLTLAQTRRLLLAKQLLTDTNMRIADIAFASGFTSVRRFNDLFRKRYRLTPGALRKQRPSVAGDDGIRLKLGYRPPLAWDALATFLTQRSAPCLAQYDGHRYLCTVASGDSRGWIAAQPAGNDNVLEVTVAPSLAGALPALRSTLRRLFDLDAETLGIAAHLRADKRLRKHVDQLPGVRIPGTLSGFELALRAIIGQQISVKAATTVFTRFVHYFGETIETPFDGLNQLAPRTQDLANADLQQIIDRGLPRRRAETIQRLAVALAEGTLRLDATVPAEQAKEALQQLPGIGPWTAKYISMRALGDPDVFPDRDLGLVRALGIEDGRALKAAAEPWRPWRAYAAMYLWQSGASGG